MAVTIGAMGLASLIAAGGAAAQPAPPIVREACSSCHAADGKSGAPEVPRLAGLQRSYLIKQLEDFVAGRRRNAVMAPALARLRPADIPAVAAFYAAQAPAKGDAVDDSLAVRGRELYLGNVDGGAQSCAECHRAEATGNDRYPRLAGQAAAYTRAQLQQFRSGARSNDKARAMRLASQRLSDAEINALAAYLAGL